MTTQQTPGAETASAEEQFAAAGETAEQEAQKGQEAPAEQEAPGQEDAPEAESAEKTGPSVDDLQKRLDENERTIQSLRSQAGNVRKQNETDALIRRLVAQNQAIVEHLSDPDADPKALKQRVEQTTEEATRQAASVQIRDQYYQDIGDAIREAGIAGDDAALNEARRLWRQGDTENPDTRTLYAALSEVNKVTRQRIREQSDKAAQEARQKAEQERQRANRETNALGVAPTGGQAAGGLSDTEMWAAYGRGEKTFADAKEAGKRLGYL